MHTIYNKQLLNSSIEKVWNFFSSPNNLSLITPPDMNFKILNTSFTHKVREGMIIHYTVTPFFYIPIKWTTEITSLNKPHIFVDEQIAGPYKFWHHQHVFEVTDDGVLMEDIVNYKLHGAVFGRIINALFVKKN